MKIPCSIIKDLLPLYHDDVCSEESKDMVEEHLSECNDCRSYYDQFDMKLPEITSDSDEASNLQNDLAMIRKVESRITLRILAVVSITVMIFTVGCIISSCIPEGTWNSVKASVRNTFPVLDTRISTDKVEVKEVYRLESGYIYCTFDIHSYVTKYMAPLNVIKDANGKLAINYHNYIESWNSISLQKSWFDFHRSDSYTSTLCMVVPETYVRHNADGTTASYTTDALYYVGKGDKILPLWDGSELPAAPPSIEQDVHENIAQDTATDPESYPGAYCETITWNIRTD